MATLRFHEVPKKLGLDPVFDAQALGIENADIGIIIKKQNGERGRVKVRDLHPFGLPSVLEKIKKAWLQ